MAAVSFLSCSKGTDMLIIGGGASGTAAGSAEAWTSCRGDAAIILDSVLDPFNNFDVDLHGRVTCN